MDSKKQKSSPTSRDQINDPVYSQPVNGKPKPQPRSRQQSKSGTEPVDDNSVDDDPVYSQPLTSKTTRTNDPVYGQTNIAQSKPDTNKNQSSDGQGTIKPLDDPVYSQSASTTGNNGNTTQKFDDPVYGQPLPPSSSSSSSTSPPPPREKGTVNTSDDPVYSQPQSQPQSRTTHNASGRLDQLSSQISPPSASEPDASVNTKRNRSRT